MQWKHWTVALKQRADPHEVKVDADKALRTLLIGTVLTNLALDRHDESIFHLYHNYSHQICMNNRVASSMTPSLLKNLTHFGDWYASATFCECKVVGLDVSGHYYDKKAKSERGMED